MALGDDFDAAVGHFDGGLIVHGVSRALYPGGPAFRLGQALVRETEVREEAEIDDSQQAVVTTGMPPVSELVPGLGSQHHAPGAEPDVDRVAQRREEAVQSGLPHPVAQGYRVPAVYQQ